MHFSTRSEYVQRWKISYLATLIYSLLLHILVKQDPNSSYELHEFKAKQELRKQYMLDGLNRHFKQIVAIITKACQDVMEENGGPFRIIETYNEEREERNLRRLKYCMESVFPSLTFSYTVGTVLYQQFALWDWSQLYEAFVAVAQRVSEETWRRDHQKRWAGWYTWQNKYEIHYVKWPWRIVVSWSSVLPSSVLWSWSYVAVAALALANYWPKWIGGRTFVGEVETDIWKYLARICDHFGFCSTAEQICTILSSFNMHTESIKFLYQ